MKRAGGDQRSLGPGGEHQAEVRTADGVVAVQVAGARLPPVREQESEVGAVHGVVAVEVGGIVEQAVAGLVDASEDALEGRFLLETC